MARNQKNINEKLAPGTALCQLFGGFEDGAVFAVSESESHLRLPTRRGKEELIAVYVRIPGNRFDFWKYER